MTNEKPIQTVAGAFDRNRLQALKDALKDQDRDSVVMFEGNELLVSYGGYLVEFIEGEFAKRNHGGL
jgi:hypothetical protein